ncbi:MAG: hypothetical protein LUC90_11650, partial [Lachnospiraceae bacterium]|nr:hypothetical protein [Lachnospiraceae bacterium]
CTVSFMVVPSARAWGFWKNTTDVVAAHYCGSLLFVEMQHGNQNFFYHKFSEKYSCTPAQCQEKRQ